MSYTKTAHFPAVSVIVPVYNAEKYLYSCLESLKNQTFDDFEVLLVDDFSVDKSREICEKYVAEYPRFKLFIHRENRGPGAARNTALDVASGETVFFLDADDFLKKNALEVLYSEFRKYSADICTGIFCYFDSTGKVKDPFTFFSEEKCWNGTEIHNEVQKHMKYPNREFLFAYAWGKLFRRSIIEKFQIRFNETMKTFEDLKFLYRFTANAEKMCFVPKMVYNYRIHANTRNLSMNVSQKHDRLNDIFCFYEEMLSFSKLVGIPVGDADNCMINLAIIHIVRHCRNLNIANFILLHRQVGNLIGKRDFAAAIENYDSSPPGRSKLMPFFMRHKLTIPLLLLGKYKAWKRYRKGK